MARSTGTMLRCLLMACAFVAMVSVGGLPTPSPGVRTVPLTRVVRLPLVTLDTLGTAATAGGHAGALTVSPGASDELPEGPNGFDVLDDGSFLITDPLPQRVAAFDSQGTFKGDWKIGFAADSVTVIPGGLVVVREASTGQLHAFDRQGRPLTQPAALPEPAEASLLSADSGSVTRPATPGGGGGLLEIRMEKPGLRLLSLESLAIDRQGDTYVALETTAGGDAAEGVNLNKVVRRYDAVGKLVCEVADIPLDYYIPPVDELRVRNGILYQLMTTSHEVRINVWDTK